MNAQPLTHLELTQFRQFHDLKLQDLGRINLLVGPNNSGKTSVLEAVELFCRPLDISTWVDTAWRREIKAARTPLPEALRWLFPMAVDYPKKHPNQIWITGTGAFSGRRLLATCEEFKEIAVQADSEQESGYVREDADEGSGLAIQLLADFEKPLPGETGETREYQNRAEFKAYTKRNLTYSSKVEEPFLEVASISPFSHRVESLSTKLFTASIKTERLDQNLREEFVRILQRLDPDILDITLVETGRTTNTLLLKHKKTGQTPLSAFGDGIRRALLIALSIPSVRNGVLLIDELETALHVSALDNVLKLLRWAADEYNVQVFATTHSLEAVDAVLKAFEQNQSDLVGYRMEKTEGRTALTRYSGPLLHETRYSMGFEIR